MARTPGLTRLGALARGVDRRTFLRGSAAVAALAASGPAVARAAAPAVAIVGAGMAGVTAALVLRQHGFTPAIFEAAARVGGRMHSETRLWDDGTSSEYCGELIDTAHITMRTLARRFGLTLDDVNAASPADARSVQYFDAAYVPFATLQAAFGPVYRTLRQQLAAIGPVTTYARHTAAGVMFDRMTIYEWIERYVPGGHRSPLGTYLDIAYLDEYGRETHVQSALNLIYWLGIQPDPDNFNRVGPSDERFHIRGGNQRLPEAIAATFPAGTIEHGARVTAIRQTAGGRVALSFAGRSAERVFDHAIVTVPFSVLRTIDLRRAGFDERKRAAIARLGYGANAKLVVQFSHRLWNGTGAWPGIGDGDIATDLPFQSTWETSAAQPGTRGLLTNYVGESQRLFAPRAPYTTTAGTPSVDAYARRFTHQLERVVPGAQQAYTGTAMLSVPLDDPNLRGAYSFWMPGQYTTIGGYERTRQGNVHFAGEHTSPHFQGFMEGAAETGALAAREIVG